jgi:hypothetical protein
LAEALRAHVLIDEEILVAELEAVQHPADRPPVTVAISVPPAADATAVRLRRRTFAEPLDHEETLQN